MKSFIIIIIIKNESSAMIRKCTKSINFSSFLKRGTISDRNTFLLPPPYENGAELFFMIVNYQMTTTVWCFEISFFRCGFAKNHCTTVTEADRTSLRWLCADSLSQLPSERPRIVVRNESGSIGGVEE